MNRPAETGPTTQLRGWPDKEGNCFMYSNRREDKFTDADGTKGVKCGDGKADCFSFLTYTLATRRSVTKAKRRSDLATDTAFWGDWPKWHGIRALFSSAL